jgi:hypothetical protein
MAGEEELGMIHSRDDGHLECDKHAGKGYLTWCEHIAEEVSLARDAALIHPVGGTTIIQCPMLPATVGLFHEVVLEPLVVRATGACVIETELNGQMFNAGYLMPGEGRGVIRENLIQWMMSQPTGTGWACKATQHGWAQKSRLDKMKVDKHTAWLMEQWCMMTTDMCTVCYKKFLDLNDVIPKDN